ncbi:MAG: hypothetical protein JNL70_04820 [Saprospiraceae bacterium]|nr:hypothetical protein [Saprospiraceae bacterium]
MAKKKSEKIPQPQPDEHLAFSDIDYVIQKLTFTYSFAQESVFQADLDIKVPDEYIAYPINICIPISVLLTQAALVDEPMTQYVQKVIDGFDDPMTREKQAFDLLAEEGFDLERLVRCALSRIHIDPKHVPKPQTEPEYKIITLGEIDYEFKGVSMGYDDKPPHVCFFNLSLKLPDHIFQENVQLGLGLESALPLVEKYDVGMTKYMRQALSENKGAHQYEVHTIQSLINEGFDLLLFLTHALKSYQIRISKTRS